MAATMNERRVIEVVSPIAVEETEVSEATLTARYCSLEESLGLDLWRLDGGVHRHFAGRPRALKERAVCRKRGRENPGTPGFPT